MDREPAAGRSWIDHLHRRPGDAYRYPLRILRFLKNLFSKPAPEPVWIPMPEEAAKIAREDVLERAYPLSLAGVEQLSLIGPPIPGDEMIVDFFFGYTGKRDEIVELNIFDESQLQALDRLGEKLLEFQRENDDVDYLLYDPTALTDDARWDDIRGLAKHCLECCGFDSAQYETEVTVTKYPDAVTHQWTLKPKTNH